MEQGIRIEKNFMNEIYCMDLFPQISDGFVSLVPSISENRASLIPPPAA